MDVVGVSAIAWYACRSCKAQVSKFIQSDSPERIGPVVDKAEAEPRVKELERLVGMG